MHKVFLLLGGNLGDRCSNLQKARELIGQQAGKVVKESSYFETEPWGFHHDQAFLNRVLLIETELDPGILLRTVLSIEQKLGRVRNYHEGYRGRTIDIDILFYDHLVMKEKELTIPHPLLQERRFTMEPLAEIAPDFVHPVFGETMEQLLQQCPDSSKVVKVKRENS